MTAAAGLGAALAPAGAQAQPAPRPNIVLVMVDDLDRGLADTLLQSGLTPNLQTHFVNRGVNFRNAFCTTPVCTPSRATLLSGRYAHNHGAARNESPFGGVTSFNDASTLATWLRGAGYQTGFIGKYLNGYGRSDINRDGVFDSADTQYIPPGWNQWFGLLDPYASRMYQYAANENGVVSGVGTAPEDYQTDLLARKAVAFLDSFETSNDAAPFFLTVMPGAPHQEVYPGLPVSQYSDAWNWTIRPAPRHLGSVLLPLPMPPSFNEMDMSDKPAWMRLRPLLTSTDTANLTGQYRDRAASMRAVDDLLGRLVARLTELGEMSRTVLIFTSDNGFLHAEHRLPQKLVAHEESIRLPLIVAAPWLAPAQAQQFVLNTDLAPTILEMAQAAPGAAMDGTSFTSLLANPGRTGWRKRFLVERWPGAASLFELPSYFAIRTAPEAAEAPSATFIQYSDGSREHYDLAIDPWQIGSLHLDASPLRQQQRLALSAWMSQLIACAGTGCRDREFHVSN